MGKVPITLAMLRYQVLPFFLKIFVVLCSFATWAQNTFLPSIQDQDLLAPKVSFIEPNEQYPAEALPLWKQSPRGLYVSVGTERGFMAAGANPNATHLLLVDRDPTVTYFNRINTALLELAENREDYLKLRLTDSSESWKIRAEKAYAEKKLSKNSYDLFTGEKAWNWWASRVRNYLTEFHNSRFKQIDAFQDVNYLANDQYFEKLSKMAKEQKIQANTLQLSDSKELLKLAQAIHASKIPLSTLDISNAYWDIYMSYDELKFLLGTFGKLAQFNSHLLLTKGSEKSWSYEAIEFQYLQDTTAAAQLLSETRRYSLFREKAVLNPKEFVRLVHPGFCVRLFSRGLRALSELLTPVPGR